LARNIIPKICNINEITTRVQKYIINKSQNKMKYIVILKYICVLLLNKKYKINQYELKMK